MRSPVPLGALLLALAGVAGACGTDPGEAAAGPGRQVYLQQCSSCHGVNREGVGTAPALAPARMVELGEAQVRSVVTQGGATMAGFASVLTDEQLNDLVAYLLSPDP